MAGDFSQTTLGSLLSFANGRSSPERTDGLPYPVYGSNGVIGYAAEANADEASIIIGRVGSYCGSLYISKQRCWVTDNAIRATARDGNDPRFLFYLLSTLSLNSWRAGSGQPLLNQDILSRIPASVPEPEEQRAIAHILGTLDDKIELNRRMSETLEAMARALFKSWFVDFDPVRAKAEGRDPGLPKPLADLFPARLVDSELGEIPEGWEVTRLGELLELAYGKALKAEDRRDGEIPVYGSNGQVGWHDERLVPGPGIVVGRKGNPGIATWVATDFFPIDTTFYVVPKGKCGSLAFLFHVLRTHDLASLGADSAVPGLNRNLAYMSSQALPAAPLLEQFEGITSALSRRVSRLADESRTLAALRDTLLPKLISGELRIKDAEKFIGRND
ncbi:MAG TPA: restriction endonuclease subunit S [Planctomycetota bacterium]|nr:restriction endonuclease subunit S [Planctomycetota bacterium]HQC03848.1 restriction endonuclease subunit S [Planctomycetota bacterium]